FSNSKSAYPVYLMLGNIPRAIWRKPSQHAYILIEYLSINKATESQLTAKKKLKAGIEEINVTGGDCAIRRVYPILACYVEDYPEHYLMTCTKYKPDLKVSNHYS
ncbi:hypothetical protein SERLA73DRAFT_44313, partial [Serpula lacrymans var. lacrymans S7.3]